MFIANTKKYVLEVVKYRWGPGLIGEEKKKNDRGASHAKAPLKPSLSNAKKNEYPEREE